MTGFYRSVPERRLRVSGYLAVTGIYFLLLMPCMAFARQHERLFIEAFLLTALHTLALWEPARLLILHLRKRFAGLSLIKRRLQLLALAAVPYAFMLGFIRMYLVNNLNFLSMPAASSYLYTIGVPVLLILLQIAVYESLYFFSEWQRRTLEAEETRRATVQIEMDSLKVQVQPHFLFNTLNTLIGLIEVNQQSAVVFTQNLAYVYRYLLQANEKTMIALEDELEFAATYFMLLKTRYTHGLELFAEVHSAKDFQMPPLTLQMLIENAVKHNVVTQSQPLHIYLYLDKRNQKLIVQNNHQPKPVKSTSGVGLKHLQKKFSLLGLPELAVRSTAEEFSVSVPLVKIKMYEHLDY